MKLSILPSLSFISAYFNERSVRLREHHLFALVEGQGKLNLAYLVLLIGSTVVSTLGLLISSTPVVIGGMIIAPLMWPIARLAMSLLLSKRKMLWEALYVIVVSVLLSLLSAVLITVFSPIKFINPEILARTNPTLIDIVVALTAGGVAAFAMTHRKISESLAGVAVAISLLPPLSVAGIGLALSNLEIFRGGFLLFSTNVLSILLACIVTFAFLGIRRPKFTLLSWSGLMGVVLSLFVISIPLFESLVSTVSQRTLYQQVENVLQTEMAQISPLLEIESIRVELDEEEDLERALVEAEIFVPESVAVSFEDQEALVSALELSLGLPISLELKMQPILTAESAENTIFEREKQVLTNTFSALVGQDLPEATIRSLEVSLDETRSLWQVEAVLGSNPDDLVTELDRQKLERQLQLAQSLEVQLDLQVIPLLELVSQPDLQNERIRNTIFDFFESISTDITVVSVHQGVESIVVKLELPQEFDLGSTEAEALNELLQLEFEVNKLIQLEIDRVEIVR